jgi:hypothetical protein
MTKKAEKRKPDLVIPAKAWLPTDGCRVTALDVALPSAIDKRKARAIPAFAGMTSKDITPSFHPP